MDIRNTVIIFGTRKTKIVRINMPNVMKQSCSQCYKPNEQAPRAVAVRVPPLTNRDMTLT